MSHTFHDIDLLIIFIVGRGSLIGWSWSGRKVAGGKF